jgi:hypothetical protein
MEIADNWKMISNATLGTPVDQSFSIAHVTTDPVTVVYEKLIAGAGATRPTRDAVDERVIRQIQTGTGKILGAQREVGGWPMLAPGKPALDTDRDGMPDAWESARRLNLHDSADGNQDRNGDGYTNLEQYLDWLVQSPVGG